MSPEEGFQVRRAKLLVLVLISSTLVVAGCKTYADKLSVPKAAEWQCADRQGVAGTDTGKYASYTVTCKDGTVHTLSVCRFKDGHIGTRETKDEMC